MDTARPRFVCIHCGFVVYCDEPRFQRYEFPPAAAEKVFLREHQGHLGCKGILPQCQAGVLPFGRLTGQKMRG